MQSCGAQLSEGFERRGNMLGGNFLTIEGEELLIRQEPFEV